MKSKPRSLLSQSPKSQSSFSSNDPPSSSARASCQKSSGIGKFRFSTNADIFRMIEAENWQQVRELMATPQGMKSCRKSDTSGLSVLGLALGYHAPLDIVATLLEIDPSSSMKYDAFHAIPLHVACLNGADLEIVNYLLDHDNNASAYSCDDDNRVALHHAVEYAFKVIQQDEDSDSGENDGIDVIRSLASAGPTMLRKMDIHGDTPIDMAQMVKYEIGSENHPNFIRAHRIYQILNDANVRLYRKEKKQWEKEKEKSKCSGTATTNISRMDELSLGDPDLSDIGSRNSKTETEMMLSNQDEGKKRKKKIFGGLFSRKSSKS